LVMELRSRYGPDFEAVMTSCAIWVNGSPSEPGTVLRAGDEVAVLPPVSGG
jgi:molybdopterin converting factor small subunit